MLWIFLFLLGQEPPEPVLVLPTKPTLVRCIPACVVETTPGHTMFIRALDLEIWRDGGAVRFRAWPGATVDVGVMYDGRELQDLSRIIQNNL